MDMDSKHALIPPVALGSAFRADLRDAQGIEPGHSQINVCPIRRRRCAHHEDRRWDVGQELPHGVCAIVSGHPDVRSSRSHRRARRAADARPSRWHACESI